jgi:hypothetical protein
MLGLTALVFPFALLGLLLFMQYVESIFVRVTVRRDVVVMIERPEPDADEVERFVAVALRPFAGRS